MDIRAVPVNHFAIFVPPVEVDGKPLGNKHPPLKHEYAFRMMVDIFRSIDGDPGIASNRRAPAKEVLLNWRLSRSRALRTSCCPARDVYCTFFLPIVWMSSPVFRPGLGSGSTPTRRRGQVEFKMVSNCRQLSDSNSAWALDDQQLIQPRRTIPRLIAATVE